MQTKEEVVEEIKSADISMYLWFPKLLLSLEDKYARGFLSASGGALGQAFAHDEKEFVELILDVCEMDIWGK